MSGYININHGAVARIDLSPCLVMGKDGRRAAVRCDVGCRPPVESKSCCSQHQLSTLTLGGSISDTDTVAIR